jgi:hypothetical protein
MELTDLANAAAGQHSGHVGQQSIPRVKISDRLTPRD